jgi:lipopolysaccharide transport system ATP-binding protein
VPSALEFAELEDFGDAPLRTYSDGMKLRLAFGVLSRFEPDALVIDEVIAVGDLRFQAKCLDWIAELRGAGTPVLLASHALDQVAENCDRVVWLERGRVRMYDDATTVVEQYRDAMRSETLGRTPAPEARSDDGLELRRNRFGSQQVTIDEVGILDEAGRQVDEIATGSGLSVTLAIQARDAGIRDAIASVSITRVRDGIAGVDTTTELHGLPAAGSGESLRVALEFDRLDLVPGDYSVDVGVHEAAFAYAYDFHWQAYRLNVTGRGGGEGLYRPAMSWRVGRDAVPTEPR